MCATSSWLNSRAVRRSRRRAPSICAAAEATKKSTYARQTAAAEAAGQSNCPLCALGHDASKSKLWKLDDMDADHVAAWSTGGATSPDNCQMLCKSHNRAKGNR